VEALGEKVGAPGRPRRASAADLGVCPTGSVMVELDEVEGDAPFEARPWLRGMRLAEEEYEEV
jgi:hypothetical protein